MAIWADGPCLHLQKIGHIALKLAVVVQRYGKDLVGGAESHARIIAKKLAENPKWQIDVYTTTARDYQSWKNFYQKGMSSDGKLRIFRFPVIFPRVRLLFSLYNNLFSLPLVKIAASSGVPNFIKKLAFRLESLWFILQGPFCPSLLKELVARKDEYQKVFFFTYLYYPSVFGIPHFREKAVFIPTAHDEIPLYFQRIKENFAKVSHMLVNSKKEQELITSIEPGFRKKMSIAGIGLEQENTNINWGGSDEISGPYLLFMGRVSKGKEVDVLIDYFLQWSATNKHEQLALVLTGPLEKNMSIPSHPLIHHLGIVNESYKHHLLAKAFAVVNPSPQESLSMLVLEGILAKKPIIINAKDPVLRSYAESMSSVFSYRNEQDFFRQLRYINSEEWAQKRSTRLLQSEKWVHEHYSWSKIMKAYHKSIYMTEATNTP
ncbi:MAG: glycosyltransferase family 4 protein [Oligoflexales bacterium]|nr:glycosyltransferase family 4 protein [Oligoflexales bacterium]